MNYGNALNELARRFSKKSDDQEFKDLAKTQFNLANLEVGKSWDWPHLESYGSVVAVPIVEGTITLTGGDRTLTISGAESDWHGRFFRVEGGENLYRIVNVNGNDITLDQDIIESGTVDYEIEKRFYPIPTEVRRIIGFDTVGNAVTSLDHPGLRQSFPNRTTPLTDHPFTVHGADQFNSEYSTGSLSATTDSDVITGSGTEWLDNVKPGYIVNFGNQDYTIKRVETDGRIIMYNKANGTYNGSYTINSGEALTVRLRGTFDKKKVIPFNYIREVHDYVNENESIGLKKGLLVVQLDYAEYYIHKHIGGGKPGWETKLLEAQGKLRREQELAVPVRSSFNMFPPIIPTGHGRN